MHVNVHILPKELNGELCVLIDVLRATSTITEALNNGALFVLPVKTLKEARRYKKEGYLLAGERGGLKPKDFDLGNSPLEFTQTVVNGKKIVLTTTNGTKALEKIKCETVVAASFLNASAVFEFIKSKKPKRVDVICAGTKGEFSLEDFFLAGYFAKLDEDPKDEAFAALQFFESPGSIEEKIMRSFHAILLKSLGFEKDVIHCSKFSIYNTVPVLKDGKFISFH